jgi:radical SAM superfamily enzyme YgiQ (UPF0313 family)
MRLRSECGVFFVTPYSRRTLWYNVNQMEKSITPPLGILYLSAYLKQHGFTKVGMLDCGVEDVTASQFSAMLREFDPSLVGVNVYAENHDLAIEYSSFVKRVCPGARVVFGNAQATFTADEMLRTSDADYICMGEGEETLLELLLRLHDGSADDLSDVRGLAWKRGEDVVINEPRRTLRPLESLPFPDRTLIVGKNYMSKMAIISGRGCPGKCKFCCSKAFWGAGVRIRSAEHTFAEISWLMENRKLLETPWGRNWFFIVDDTFTLDPRRVQRLCDYLIDARFDAHWHCSSRIDVLDRSLMEKMYAAGCRHIQIGVESAEQDVLDKAGKNIDLGGLEHKLDMARELGIGVQAGFMIGFPEDTPESIRRNVEYAKYIWETYDIDTVTLAYNTPFPGTAYHRDAKKMGLRIHAKHWREYAITNPIVSNGRFNVQDLTSVYHDFQNFSRRMRGKQFRSGKRFEHRTMRLS